MIACVNLVNWRYFSATWARTYSHIPAGL